MLLGAPLPAVCAGSEFLAFRSEILTALWGCQVDVRREGVLVRLQSFHAGAASRIELSPPDICMAAHSKLTACCPQSYCAMLSL